MVLMGPTQGIPWFCGSNWPELSSPGLRPLLLPSHLFLMDNSRLDFIHV